MLKVIEETAAYEMYKRQYPSIVDLQERKSEICNDRQRALFVNSIIADYKRQEIEALLARRANVDEIFAYLGLEDERELVHMIRGLIYRDEFVMDELYWICGIGSTTGGKNALLWDIQTRLQEGNYLGARGSITCLEKQTNIVRLRVDEDLNKGKILSRLLAVLGLDVTAKAIKGIEQYLVKVEHPQVDELISQSATAEWFKHFFFNAAITVAIMDQYFQVGAYLQQWNTRSFFRSLFRLFTGNGLVTQSFFLGLAKLNFIFGLIYANVTSEFLSEHVQRVSSEMTDDVRDVATGLRRWGIAIGIVAFLAFITYESQRLYWHIPRCCRRRDSRGRYSCCGGVGKFRLVDWNLSRRARRYRQRFEQIIQQDVEYDPEAPTYVFEYDSENDDPDVAVYYYHIRERERASHHPSTRQSEVTRRARIDHLHKKRG